jgi:glycosyltransferase involved in cell wall biosynthesis
MSVSVVIPTFNRCGFVGEAVASVCAQRGVEYEIIAVDDGSTDDTAAVLENHFGARVHILRTENHGVAAARNLGVAASRGELIAFLDSDDLWLPGKLAAQTGFFAAHPEAEICQTEEIWIRNGVRVNPCAHHRKPSGDIFEPSLRLCLVSPSAVMLRRELFERVGGFDERLPVCEDYDLWLRIARDTPVWLIHQQLVVKRGGHADQLSRRFWGMDRFRVAALTRLLEKGELTFAQRQATLRVLTDKCAILAKGAARRGRHAEAEMHRLLPDRLRSAPSLAPGSSPGLKDAKPAEAGVLSDQPDSSGVLSFGRGLEPTTVVGDSGG